MLTALLVASLSPAHAQDTLGYWSWNDFRDDTSYADTDGWRGGYRTDEWIGYEGGDGLSWVFSTTDESGGDFGDGGPHDNWLVQTEVDYDDGVATALLYTEDDDAVGFVARHQDAENYYLFLMTAGEDRSISPLDDYITEAVLVRISDGEADVLGRARGVYEPGNISRMAIAYNDGQLTASYWVDGFGDEPDIVVEATDDDPLPPGAFGFYGYNAGSLGGTVAVFGATDVLRFDDDGDGVADDEDNCETISNPDQQDRDGNGVGSACDPNESTGDDGGGDGGGDGGDGLGGNGDGTGDGGTDTAAPTDLTYEAGGDVSGCSGCDGGGGAVGGLLLAALAGVARRRRDD